MSFSIHFDKQPEKFLRKLDKHFATRIIDKIEETLCENPVPHSAVVIVGEHGVFRIRIGYYRALYRVNYEDKKVIVVKIDNRSRIYD